jgi:asparagine synthase (glutamine-hydrolysing)
MTDRLAHRGPDAEGFFVGNAAALGHRRLSIIDLSAAANQPLYDDSGRYAIILNGEIYNYRDIRSSLPDYAYKTDGDSEAILAAFLKHGPECLSLLKGMFAFAIWDELEEELFIARDRLGVKPLYYSIADGALVFASEIRSILESDLVPRQLSRPALFEYLQYQSVYSPRTLVENIFQLPAGSYGLFKGGRLAVESYWQVEKPKEFYAVADRSKVLRTMRDLFARSIETRMVSDVPVGAFLSGGIDSSAVVAMMSEVSGRRINTFSVTFDDPDFDESRYAELVAEKYKTEHLSVRLSANDLLAELPNALKAMDSPSGDGLNTYVVSKATKGAGLKVALSGLGGDELFAGYHYFRKWLGLKNGILPRLPLTGRKLAAGMLAAAPGSRLQRMAELLAAGSFDLSEVYPRTRQVMSEKSALAYGRNGYVDQLRLSLEAKKDDIDRFPLLSQFTIGELLGYTQNVLLKDTDQFSMASALEVREPFFDHRLVEYMLQVPDSMKLSHTPKNLLVDALGEMLPSSIVDRPKMGFVLPFEKWMRGELKQFCSDRVDQLAERAIVDPDTLTERWRRFSRGERNIRWSELWHLIVLTEWLEINRF